METRRRLGLAQNGFQEMLPNEQRDRLPDSPDTLREALEAYPDPVDLLEAAAVDDEEALAAAATPYLLQEVPLPEGQTTAKPPGPAVDPDTGAEPSSLAEERRVTTATDPEVRSLRRDLKAALKLASDLQTEVDRLTGQVEASRAESAKLRGQLPTARQRRALEGAVERDKRARKLSRQISQLQKGRDADRKAFEEKLREITTTLEQVRGDADAERRGRRRLENELGDAAARARRLEPLALREADDLETAASSMRAGPAKTRMMKRADELRAVVSTLRDLYPISEEEGVSTVRGGSTDVTPTAQSAGSSSSAVDTLATTSPQSLRVTALGGARHIGGSCLLVEAAGSRVLIDAGLRPDAGIGGNPGPEHIQEALDGDLAAIVITHAHADHAGYVPWVLERQRRARIVCSRETAALLPTVWADSVRVMRAEADTISVHGTHIEPPYGDAEVSQAEDARHPVAPGRTYEVGDLRLTLFKAGHILGASGVVVQAGDHRVVVTGDIDDRGQASVGPAQVPLGLAGGADLLVIETTYCDRQHEDRDQEGASLIRQTEEVLAVGGRVLIPAFGLGRAQEIALLLGRDLSDVDVLVDGLARDISELYARHGAPQVLQRRVRKVENRNREIRGFTSGVVITTSGMLTGGAAIPWAQAVLTEPDSALFLCGHQDEEAPGRELERLAEADPAAPREVLLRDDEGRPVKVHVEAAIHRYNLSAHADSRGLMDIITQVNPKAIMLVHGEPRPQALFGARLRGSGYRVVDNQQAWDPDAPLLDQRSARWRHSSNRPRRPGGSR